MPQVNSYSVMMINYCPRHHSGFTTLCRVLLWSLVLHWLVNTKNSVVSDVISTTEIFDEANKLHLVYLIERSDYDAMMMEQYYIFLIVLLGTQTWKLCGYYFREQEMR